MSVGDLILLGLAIIGSVPIVVLACETLAAICPRRRTAASMADLRPRCAILIPAHDEAGGIGATVELVRSQLQPGDRLIVIADNCSDETAFVARQAGAEAIERNDPERRGKGFALDFGLNHLQADPPEIVVLMDADTRAHPQSIDRLIREAHRRNGPAQGVFTDAPKMRGPREQWSAFALTFKNYVRPLGLHQLGLPCLLYGSGMAFPWSVIRKAELASGNIVEDMKLGIDLAVVGHPAHFCPDARFESDDAPNMVASTKRRTRWEHGHVFTIMTQAPRLLVAGFAKGRPRLWALALELAVPPLSLLILSMCALAVVSFIWWQMDGSIWPLGVLLGSGCLAVVTILTAWIMFGRRLLSTKILFLLPVYVLWKVPIYLKLVIAPQRSWVRTERKPAS